MPTLAFPGDIAILSLPLSVVSTLTLENDRFLLNLAANRNMYFATEFFAARRNETPYHLMLTATEIFEADLHKLQVYVRGETCKRRRLVICQFIDC